MSKLSHSDDETMEKIERANRARRGEMPDLVARLRELDRSGYQPLTGAIGEEAAAEIEKLRKDAARYRWLRANPTWMGWDADFRPDEIEREIDSAMPQEIRS